MITLVVIALMGFNVVKTAKYSHDYNVFVRNLRPCRIDITDPNNSPELEQLFNESRQKKNLKTTN